MIKEITMPKIGYTMEEGKIIKWLKKEGDFVAAGEPVMEIESDKANIEIEAQHEGVLHKILFEEGEYVPVMQAVGLIGEPGDSISDTGKKLKTAPEVANPEVVRSIPMLLVAKQNRGNGLSPRARKFAREKAIDEKKIQIEQGTGYKGMIVERDLKKLLENQKSSFSLSTDTQYVTPSAIKQATAKRLTQSVQDIPQFFMGIEANAENLLHLRQRIDEAVQGKLSITAMLVKCVSNAIWEHRGKANVSWDNGKIRLHPVIRMGVAVATDRGLVVAVIDSSDQKSMGEIDAELRVLSEKARNGKLALEEMTGSTFTISNLGMYGVDEFNAIINPPESGILAVGRTIKKNIVLKDDTIAVKPMMHLSLTVDHRVLDGADAALLLGSIKKYIEHPELML